METEKLTIAFGRRNFPDNLRAVWGARLIWPDDLVQDRQDLGWHDEEAKAELVRWLDGSPLGSGAIAKMRKALRDPVALGLRGDSDNEAVIYEDDKGKIIGSAQSSYGYLYVCGWLFVHEAE